MIALHTPYGIVHVTDPATVSSLIARQEAGGAGYRAPLYKLALAGDLDVRELLRGGRLPASALDHTGPATVVVVGDDAGTRSRGPADFPQAGRLAAWCSAVLLHAAGGEPWHYQLAAEWGRRYGRTLLIETDSEREAAWALLLDVEATRRNRAGLPALHGQRIVCRVGPHPLPETMA